MSWTKETNTKAASTGRTQDTTFQLDSGQNFIVKNSSAATILSIAESTGVLTLANGETIDNSTDNLIRFTGGSSFNELRIVTDGGQDVMLTFFEGIGMWAIGNDVTDNSLVINSGSDLGTSGGDFKLDTSGNCTIAGDLTISGGNITNAIVCDSTVTTTGLLTSTAGVKLGNNIIYASDGGSTITLDDSDNVTILGDLTVTGGDIDITGEASLIKIKNNDSSSCEIGSSPGVKLITFDTTSQQEKITIGGGLILEHDSGTSIGINPIIQTQGNITVASSRDDAYSNGIGLKPVYVNTSGTNTIARHNYLTINTVDKAATGGSLAITDVCLLELEDDLGTVLSCTNNTNKAVNANSGTLKVNVNGTIYHIQLYADS